VRGRIDTFQSLLSNPSPAAGYSVLNEIKIIALIFTLLKGYARIDNVNKRNISEYISYGTVLGATIYLCVSSYLARLVSATAIIRWYTLVLSLNYRGVMLYLIFHLL
jgi:hypothetical protein